MDRKRQIFRLRNAGHGQTLVVMEESFIRKDMEELELKIKQAFSESENPAQAAGKIMPIVRGHFDKYLTSFMSGGPSDYRNLVNRILTVKKQVNELNKN